MSSKSVFWALIRPYVSDGKKGVKCPPGRHLGGFEGGPTPPRGVAVLISPPPSSSPPHLYQPAFIIYICIKDFAPFFINICELIHSYCTVDIFYSQVNLIKNSLRNLLKVDTVSSILQVKTYYKEEDDFEVNDKHLEYYRHYIKDTKSNDN